MAYLLDTNILARLASSKDALYPITDRAIVSLRQRGEILRVTPQVLIEFRAIATRPVATNGLGLSITEAEANAADFEAIFPILPDIPTIFPAWKALVEAVGVIGKQVHDARLVVVCHAHGVTHLLTFNGAHFARLAAAGPGLVVVDPAGV